jgi:hypothetical protein
MTDLASDTVTVRTRQSQPDTRATWVLNPQVKWRAVQGSEGTQFELAAPVPGEGLKLTTLTADARRRLDAALDRAVDANRTLRPGVSGAVAAALQRVGLLVDAASVPEAVLFRCDSTRRLWTLDSDPSLSAGVRLQGLGADSSELPEHLRDCAVLDEQPIAWIHDPARGVEWPFWLGTEQVGQWPNDDEHAQAVTVLNERVRTWDARLAQARDDLASRGYAVLHEFVPSAFLRAIQDYYGRLVPNGFLVRGDSQALRYTRHNEPFACWLHCHTLPLIRRVVSKPLRPSYAYLGFYLGGAALERHTDRPQCEHTLSLSIDAHPSARREEAWPLCLELADGSTAAVLLAPGDAVLFKGTERPHYRDRLANGRTSWSMFLHYVREDFAGSLD